MKSKSEILDQFRRAQEETGKTKGHLQSQWLGYADALEWVLADE